MSNLKTRIAHLEQANAPSGAVLIYQGDAPAEKGTAEALAASAQGIVIVVSPVDLAL